MNIRVLVGATSVVIGVSAPASSQTVQVHITGHGCTSVLKVKIQNTKLSEALSRLAREWDFDVHFEDSNDPVIATEVTGTGPSIVRALLEPSGRFMVLTKPDLHCRGQQRVSSVWLVPGPGGSSGLPPTMYARGPSDRRAAARPNDRGQRERTPAELERLRSEESRQRKERYDQYMAAYGRPPPEMEEDASHGLAPSGMAPK